MSHYRRAVVTLLAAFALLWPATLEASTTMKCALGTINDVQHEWCKRLIARLEKATNGFVKGQVFPAAQLGTGAQMLTAVQLGTIEAYIVPPEFLIGIDPRFMVLTAPYLFDSPDHAHRVLNDREFLDKFLALGEAKNFKGVSLMVYGPVGIATRTPLRSPDDLKGKKIRINATPIEQAMMTAFGATGVPMGLVEALTAAQQGVVDGVQSGLPAIANFKFYELTKYHANTHHFYITSIGLVGKRWLESLPANVQRAIVEEARALHPELLAVTKQANQAAEAAWKAGSKDGWIELTPEQRAAFRNRVEGIDSKIVEQYPQVKEMLELVRRKAKELR